MIIKLKFTLLFFTFFSAVFVSAQIDDSKKVTTLQEKIDENKQLLMTDPDQAFLRIDVLLKQAKKEENKEAELTLLSHHCWYLINKDLKKAINATQKLQAKAKEYGNIYYQAVAHEYFSNIYIRSELPDKALEEFESAIKLLNRINNKTKKQDIVQLKANAYTIANEAYKYKREPHKAAQMLLKANKEIKKLIDSERKKLLLRANYTNLGGVYAEINVDSAEHFANQSLLLSNGDEKPDMIQFNNYILLGHIHKGRKDYAKAIENYKKAESKIPYINPTLENINSIYNNLAEIYKNTDSLKQANHYLQQLQHSLLRQEQNKNQSLHKIIDEELLKEKNYSLYIGIGGGVLLLISLGLMFRLHRKNKLLEKQEKADEAYLQVNQPTQLQDMEIYTRLAELARNDDQAFIVAFHDQFPDFYNKLLEINPKLVESEIKFCAFLKLKLSTKEIAQIQNIEPSTVKNKKNRIRKRLNIPPDRELYYFFNQL